MLWLAAAPFMPLVSVVRGTYFVLIALAFPSVEVKLLASGQSLSSLRPSITIFNPFLSSLF